MRWTGAAGWPVAGMLLAFASAVVNRVDTALAVHDPAISVTWPSFAWASQAHSFGHDGWSASNFPTYYGAADMVAGEFNTMDGPTVAGENGCGPNRSPNMEIAEDRSEESTTDEPQLPDWPTTSGLLMEFISCDMNEDSYGQLTTWVSSTNCGTPGCAYHFAASSAQCASLGMSYPCGEWNGLVQVRISWWNSATDVQRRKFLLHEWGHLWGMGDYCNPNHNAISKDGTPQCLWPPETKYYDTDDRAFYLIYGQ